VLLSAISGCFLTCPRAYLLMTDNANLLDATDIGKAGRFVHHIVDESAAVR